MSQPVLSSELFATSLNSKSFPWIHVSFAHVIDQKFQNVYKVVLKTNSDIEWVVMHRFKIYRNLFKKLSELNIHLSNPFPPTFFKSKLGIGLSNVQITERADMLEKVAKCQPHHCFHNRCIDILSCRTFSVDIRIVFNIWGFK